MNLTNSPDSDFEQTELRMASFWVVFIETTGKGYKIGLFVINQPSYRSADIS